MDDFTKLDPEERSIHILGGDGDAEDMQAVIVEKDLWVRSTLKGPEVPLTSYCSVGIPAD
jgi:hypothetical protein